MRRLLGQDVCVIVFVDGASSYMPTTISSRMNRTCGPPTPRSPPVLPDAPPRTELPAGRVEAHAGTGAVADVFAVVRPNADNTYRYGRMQGRRLSEAGWSGVAFIDVA